MRGPLARLRHLLLPRRRPRMCQRRAPGGAAMTTSVAGVALRLRLQRRRILLQTRTSLLVGLEATMTCSRTFGSRLVTGLLKQAGRHSGVVAYIKAQMREG